MQLNQNIFQSLDLGWFLVMLCLFLVCWGFFVVCVVDLVLICVLRAEKVSGSSSNKLQFTL